jgi:hypothetical protein
LTASCASEGLGTGVDLTLGDVVVAEGKEPPGVEEGLLRSYKGTIDIIACVA